MQDRPSQRAAPGYDRRLIASFASRKEVSHIAQSPPNAYSRGKSRSDSSLADEAYAAFRHMIIRCDVLPGARVTQSRLAADLGIGKTPVREALARLVSEGLMISMPQHGYRVAPVTLRDVRELLDLRLIVEPAAAELACRHATDEVLRHLEALCLIHPGGEGRESLDEFMSLSREFHIGIARASGNGRLAQLIQRLVDDSQRVFYFQMRFGFPGESIQHEHHHLAEALLARDSKGARGIVENQTLETMRNVLEALTSSPTLLSAHLEPPSDIPGAALSEKAGLGYR